MKTPQIVIPMAGQGQRFADADYALPKPLIPVAGIPMVVRVVRDLPDASRVVLLVRTEHIEKFSLDREIKKYLPNAILVPVERLTEGQACTVRLAADFLDPHAPVIVGACDNTHLYSSQALADKMARKDLSCLVWTYRGEPRVQIKPTSYGWVKTYKNGALVEKVSCKVPISHEPVKDHVVSGFFSFQSAQLMNDAIDKMVASNDRVNNEFYMDTVPNVLISDGHGVEVFEVEKYIGWGTPDDYEDFLKWEKYCANLS